MRSAVRPKCSSSASAGRSAARVVPRPSTSIRDRNRSDQRFAVDRRRRAGTLVTVRAAKGRGVILVIGGRSKIGAALIDGLLERGQQVRALSARGGRRHVPGGGRDRHRRPRRRGLAGAGDGGDREGVPAVQPAPRRGQLASQRHRRRAPDRGAAAGAQFDHRRRPGDSGGVRQRAHRLRSLPRGLRARLCDPSAQPLPAEHPRVD